MTQRCRGLAVYLDITRHGLYVETGFRVETGLRPARPSYLLDYKLQHMKPVVTLRALLISVLLIGFVTPAAAQQIDSTKLEGMAPGRSAPLA